MIVHNGGACLDVLAHILPAVILVSPCGWMSIVIKEISL
jgi:hypothetical protein